LETSAIISMPTQIDSHRFEQLFCGERPYLLAVALRLTRGDKARAEDVVQDASVRAFKGFHAYRAESPFRTWLVSILRNCFVDQCRGRREISLEALPQGGTLIPAPIEIHQFEGVAGEIEALVATGEVPAAEVLSVFIEGDDYQACADRLRIPIGTVRSRVHRLRRYLQTHVDARGLYGFSV
jgi:RNA polymerase sigma-70 factor (ECF subfamily)